MRHAVRAFGIVAGAIAVPVRFFHQRFECRRITFVHEQVTRALPTEHVACGVAPRCATVTLIAGEEVQKQARVVEPPAALLAEAENISEQLFARLAPDENVLLRRMLVTEARRNGHALHAQRHRFIEKTCHLLCGFALEQRAIDCQPKAPLNRLLDCLHSFIKHASSAH